MKKKIVLILSVFLAFTANAQQSLNVIQGNVSYSFPATEETVFFSGDKTVTVEGVEFTLSDITKIEVSENEIEENTVLVEFSGNEAFVTVAGNIARFITAKISGANVTVDQSDEVSGDNCGEITYILKGESSDGSFTQNGSYKSTIELQGLTLNSNTGAAIDIENGKRIELSAKNGTVNTISDSKDGKQKAAIYCKGHLELKGKGTLTVTGNTAHAISAKEYISMKNCTVNVQASVKDGINCNQYFLMESGTLNITDPGDDGIQVSYKDDSDREAEDTGSITIEDGVITINDITASAAKGMKADGSIYITGGELVISTSAPGEWDSSKQKTKASACIGADGDVEISGGFLDLTASGGGGKGITCDGTFTFNEGDLTILTKGGVLAYVNNSLNQNYTGNTDRINSDLKSSPKGIKADGDVEINGGIMFITTSGNGGEGIESKSELTVNGGNVKVRAKDDAINSAKTMYIKDGVIDVISTSNDGLDSNGDLRIEGGLVMAFGGSAPECGLDANSEEGYTVYFTGGYILAAGGGNSVPTKSGTTQPYVSVNVTLAADAEVSIGTGSDTIYTFKTPEDLTNVNLGGSGQGNRPGGMGGGNGSSVLISVPNLTTGTNYTVKCGSSSASASAVLTGSSNGQRPR